ncbi:MAG TPA: MBL fold metallo-hydrolase [Aeromicrobium sp.]|nr:MBL fold metallo-hydrolase [Aeromicrobium sp.]
MITEVNETVVAVQGRDVNWTILRDGSEFTLVDAGYPGYTAAVSDSLRHLGLDLSGLQAIVVTHAHVDHIGGVPALRRERPVPVYVGRLEVPMAVGERMEQATPLDIARNLWRPRYVPWSTRITLAGGASHARVPDAIGVEHGQVLQVPGMPTVVLTPGHTSGHICLQVGDAVLTGDALITGHAVTSRRGPQLIPPVFHHDPDGARLALARIGDLNAGAIVPGHGPVWHGTPAEAVSQALRPAAVDR